MDNPSELRTSRSHEIKGIVFMLVTAVFIALAQVLFKAGTGTRWWLAWITAGMFIYAISLYFNLKAYELGRLSILFPISALSYVIAVVAGVTIFGESISLINVAGLACIIAGTFTIGSAAGRQGKTTS